MVQFVTYVHVNSMLIIFQVLKFYNLSIDIRRHLLWFQFDEPQLAIKGNKVDLKTDESFMFWTPAPPKWDVSSQYVKDALFPNYKTGLAETVWEKGQTDHQSSDSEEESDGEPEKENPQDKAARER